MLRLICNNRGIGLIEVVIALFLVSIGVLALLSMQPSAWKLVGKSDYLGRGAGILHRALETREAWIMNPCNIVPAVPNGWPEQIIYVSGVAGIASGDATYTVDTTLANPSADLWQVTVTVTWNDQVQHNYRNLQESIIITRQEAFRFGCPTNTTTPTYPLPNPLPAGL